jgi:hypothetical protein
MGIIDVTDSLLNIENLKIKIKMALGAEHEFLDFNEIISNKIRWSTISIIGKSWPVRVMIFVPFLGYILIFNENVFNVFQFAKFFMDDMGLNIQEQQVKYTIRSLYLTYFGMCSFGIASALYSIFCPIEIKKYGWILDYVNSVEMEKTPVLAKSNLSFVLDKYFLHRNEEDGNTSAEYPYEVDLDFYNLISEMFRESEDDFGAIADMENDTVSGADTKSQSLAESLSADEDDFWHSSFYTGSGYPNIHEIAKAVWSNAKIMWVFTIPFRSLAPKFAKDIAFLKYKNLDCQNFGVRFFIFIAYFIGFTFLSIPTVNTFFQLTVALFQ